MTTTIQERFGSSLEDGRTKCLFTDPDFHLNEDGLREGLIVLKSEDIEPREMEEADWKAVEKSINAAFRQEGMDDECDFYVVAISGPDDDGIGLSYWKGAINEMRFAKQRDVDCTWEQMKSVIEVDAQGNHRVPMEKSPLAMAMLITNTGAVH
jgi:hypothetical protein